MTRLRDRFQTWLGGRTAPAESPAPAPVKATAEAEPDLFCIADGLADGTPCPAALLAALDALIVSRRVRAGVDDGPPAPRLTALHIRRSGLPDWWNEGENLLLVGQDAVVPELRAEIYRPPPRRAVVALGAGSLFNHINIGREGALVVLGDSVSAHSGAMSCLGRSSVLLGEDTTCTGWAMLDCRNGGIILAGDDGMWAHGVSLMTDDSHAIRDAETGRRVNTFGGRIVVGRHVWLCEQARLLDGARVGPHAVIGSAALVKRGTIPPNTVSVGAPARVVRSGITWNRKDEP